MKEYKPPIYDQPTLVLIIGDFDIGSLDISSVDKDPSDILKSLGMGSVDKDTLDMDSLKQRYLFWKRMFYPKTMEDPHAPRHHFIEPTFVAYPYNGKRKEDYIVCGVNPTGISHVAKRKNKVLLIDYNVQEAINEVISSGGNGNRNPTVSDFLQYGIIRFTQKETEERVKYIARNKGLEHKTKVLSVVVSGQDPASLDATLGSQLSNEADIVIVGFRDPEVYTALVRAWHSGTISPKKYKGTYFNPERFETQKNGLLRPI